MAGPGRKMQNPDGGKIRGEAVNEPDLGRDVRFASPRPTGLRRGLRPPPCFDEANDAAGNDNGFETEGSPVKKW